MSSTLALTAGTRRTAGILLLTVAAVESGGWLMLPYLAHPAADGVGGRSKSRLGRRLRRVEVRHLINDVE
jgi:hypothetical protein